MTQPKKLPIKMLEYKTKKANSEDYSYCQLCDICGQDSRDLPELLSHIAALDEEIEFINITINKVNNKASEQLDAVRKENVEYKRMVGLNPDWYSERNQLRAENEKQASRISELEAGLKDLSDAIQGTEMYFAARDHARILLSPKDTQGDK